MHVLRMLIKLASLVHKCSGEEHFLALWNLARRGARVFTSSSPDSACWKEESLHTCSDEFRCKNSALALGALHTGRRYCVHLRPHYAVSEITALEANVPAEAPFIAACCGEAISHH